MTFIRSLKQFVELKVINYQPPKIMDRECDSNWLLIYLKVIIIAEIENLLMFIIGILINGFNLDNDFILSQHLLFLKLYVQNLLN